MNRQIEQIIAEHKRREIAPMFQGAIGVLIEGWETMTAEQRQPFFDKFYIKRGFKNQYYAYSK